jgi:hypothetical protein
VTGAERFDSSRNARHSLNEHFGKDADRNIHEKDSGPQPGIRASHRRNPAPILAATAAAFGLGFMLGRNWPVVAVAIGAVAAKPVARSVSSRAAHAAGDAAHLAGRAATSAAHVAGQTAARTAEVAGHRGKIVAEKAFEASKGVVATTGELAAAGLATGAALTGTVMKEGGHVIENAGKAIAISAKRMKRENKRSHARRGRGMMWAAGRNAAKGLRRAGEAVSERIPHRA